MDLDRINFLLTETDRHLLGIQTMIPLLREIKDELQQIKFQIFANQELHNLNAKVDKLINPNRDEYGETYSKINELIKECPKAIDPDLICDKNSEPDKEYRANCIIEFFIDDYLKDMNFLDFGCGEGHIVKAAKDAGAAISLGYDIENQGWDRFDQSDKFLLTADFEKIKENAPYDVILLYDVLDHLKNENPWEVLKKLQQILKEDGKIYVRCHPWCSRHGTHLYEKGFNKAFVHLILDDIELVRLGGYSNKEVTKLTEPLNSYREWIGKSGLKVLKENITEEKVEEFFFVNQDVWNKIHSQWNGKDPAEHLKISFVDYVLTSNTSQVF